MKSAPFIALFLLSATGWSAESAPASSRPRSGILFLEENDKFGTAGTDRYYTQGLKLIFSSGQHTYFSLTQEINTPADTDNPNPDPSDQPYSGALYVACGYGKVFDRQGRRDCMGSVELKLGVIGPSSGAETIQNKFHILIGTDQAKGWGTQVPDEVAINLDAEFRRRFTFGQAERPHSDLIARAVGQLGNLRTEFILGTQYRLGYNLDRSWGQMFIRHSNGYEPDPDDGAGGFSCWVFADAQVEVVVRNYSLDGGNFRESRGVDRRPVVGQAALGATLRSGSWGFTVFTALRTLEFVTQTEGHAFGGFKGDLRF